MDNGFGSAQHWRRLRMIQSVWPIGVVVVGALSGPCSGAAEGRQNSAPRLAVPEFSTPGGVNTNGLAVRLTASTSSGVVRYTLDGSDPTAASPQYSGPIEIVDTTLLKARVFEAHSADNPTVSQTYIMMEPDLAGFSSNLPLVIIDSFGQSIPHEQKVPVSARFIDAKGARSTLAGPADFAGRGDLNVRGRSSLRYPKHSYHLQTKDETHHPLNVALLGFPKESDWILYAPYPDKTLMRDVLAYELSNRIGRYASRTRFVEVFVNESGGRLAQRHYQGVYVLEEKIKRGENRVDIRKLRPEDNTEPNIAGGYIIKKDHTDQGKMQEGVFSLLGPFPPATPPGFHSSQGNPFFYVEPKAEEITAQQKAWLRRYINTFERVLSGDHFDDPKTGYAAYIDPDSFIDHHLLVELTKNIDGFRFSTFYYMDRGGKLGMGPIWDWNLSFGNANGKEGWIPEGWYWPQLDDQQYSWFRRLFEDPDFAQNYTDRWGELRTNQFAIANIHARIDQMAELLDEAQARNYRRWRILGQNVGPNTYVGRTFSDEVNWMKRWIQTRIEWIDRQFIAAPSFSLKAGAVARGSKLELRAPTGKTYYTLDGSDPRGRGGVVSPAARLYSSAVVLNDAAAVFCRARQENRWSYPAFAKFAVAKPASITGH